jgi:flagellar P-ring protein precursor FlgI
MRRLLTLLALWAAVAAPPPAHAARILEVCEVAGVRPNQLVGYGLVVGLRNTGDIGQARFTLQSVAAALRRLGATIDPGMIQTMNAAAVMVTATLPPNANPGMAIDVTVSSIGNARSLAGGQLIQTPLFGADGQVYAVGQGAVLLGGFGATGGSGSSVQVNHLTAGRVPGGGLVERRVAGSGPPTDGPIRLTLRDPSFITARRVVTAIDEALQPGTARALDSGTVEVTVPETYAEDRIGLLAMIQQLEVEPDAPARVVIDERTGTVVIGANVRIGRAAVAQGGLTVTIDEAPIVSQPGPLSGGDTAVVPDSDVEATVEGGALRVVGPTATLADVVNALNSLGARPRDLIAIFQAMASAGALHARIEVQ